MVGVDGLKLLGWGLRGSRCEAGAVPELDGSPHGDPSQVACPRRCRTPSIERVQAVFPSFGHVPRAARAAQGNGSRPDRPTVLLTAHGTRDQDGASEARAFAERLAERLGPNLPLVPCFLELTDPPILDTITRLAQARVN